MKIASVALLMVSTFLVICSRVSLSNKKECQVWGMFSVTFILVFCRGFVKVLSADTVLYTRPHERSDVSVQLTAVFYTSTQVHN